MRPHPTHSQRSHPDYDVFCFDSIGVPSAEVMFSYGTGHEPGGAWQRAMTVQWFERIAPIVEGGRSVLFEGQMRIAFILEALQRRPLPNVHVLLVECGGSIRAARLMHDRGQPELANDSMRGWSRYLKREAVKEGIEILDTGENSLADSVACVLRHLGS